MDEKNKSKITKKEKLINLKSSIFLPIHIRDKLLINVAKAYIEPNCPWLIFKSILILELNSPIKKLCPKLEKNVNINPKIIILKFDLIISIIII